MSEPNLPTSEPKGPSFPNKWLLATAVLGVLLIASISFNVMNVSGITGMAIAKDTVGEKVVTYISNNFEVTPELINVNETNGMYAVEIKIEGTPYLMYMSKDGKLLFPQVFVLADTKTTATTTPKTETKSSVPKSDKPSVELFIMSECPYGTQIEKGMLPVAELLGDKIDFNVRFVFYAMHGEKEIFEQLRQHCIQTEQRDKFNDYLACYLKAGNSSACLVEAKIDSNKMATCVAKADTQFDVTKNFNNQTSWLSGRFPLFNVDLAANEEYGVQGSPTLVINGVQSTAGRDSASLLAAVCDAFNNKPSECSQTLSSTAPSAGFGYGTGSDSSATCG